MELGQILLTAVNAVVPIILTILLGYFLRRCNFLNEGFLKAGNKLVFRIGLPAVLFVNVYEIKDLSQIPWDMIFYASAAVLLIFFLGLLTAVFATPLPARRGALLQSTFRSNSAIIGLALASMLGDADAEMVASCVLAVTTPIFNILSVIALTIFSPEAKRISVIQILKDIARNPLIQAVAAGIVVVLLRILLQQQFGENAFRIDRDLSFVYTVLTWMKSITTPLSLIVLGGQFVFSAVKALRKEIILGTVWRIVLAPLIAIGGAALLTSLGILQCSSQDYPCLIGLFASPVSVSSAVMAAEMGSDDQLATQLVVWSTVFSAITVFAVVCVLMATGLLIV